MTRIKLRYVNEYRDRHGKRRRYFRRPGSRSIPLPGLPGSIEFMSAYQAALAVKAPPPPSPRHVIAGSLAAIVAGYLRSRFRELVTDIAILVPVGTKTDFGCPRPPTRSRPSENRSAAHRRRNRRYSPWYG